MAKPTLVVMAAGIGSRYGGLKQIDAVGPSNEIVIDYSIYDAIKAGFDKVVFIIRRDFEQDFRDKIGFVVESRVDTAYVYQDLDALPDGFSVPAGREKPWGTAHAVLTAKNHVTAPFGVINADDFYGPAAYKVLYDFLIEADAAESVGHYGLVGYVLKNTLSDHGHVARGVVKANKKGFLTKIDERLKIQKFGEKVKWTEDNGKTWVEESPESMVSMNIWGFTPSLFGFIEEGFPAFLNGAKGNPKAEYLLPVRVGELVNEKKANVQVLKTDEKWHGITYKEDKPFVQQAIRGLVDQGVYPEKLWS